MKLKSCNRCLVAFMIFIILSSLLVRTRAYVTNTYSMSEDNLYMSSDNNNLALQFPDGSRLFRFYRPIDDECYEPILHLKLLHRNGTTSNFDIQNLSIPRLNFCKLPGLMNDSYYHNKTGYDHIYTTSMMTPDIFYIFYYNISEGDP